MSTPTACLELVPLSSTLEAGGWSRGHLESEVPHLMGLHDATETVHAYISYEYVYMQACPLVGRVDRLKMVKVCMHATITDTSVDKQTNKQMNKHIDSGVCMCFLF